MRPRTAAVAVIEHTRGVIAGRVSVWTSFVYVAFHTASKARFANWATASGVLISCTTSQALFLVRARFCRKKYLEGRTIWWGQSLAL